MQEIRLSPSMIADFKACPKRCLLGYFYGLQPEKEKDSQRIGKNWHRCHEILGMIPQGKCPQCLKWEEIREDCYLCNGTGVLPENLMDAVIRFLNYAYARVPENKTHEQWEIERINILHSFAAYQWYYSEVQDRFETVASEIKFVLPIVNPQTNKKLSKVCSVGKVDELVRDKTTGLLYIRERKSTNSSILDSRYWNRLETDVQITNYLYGLRIWQRMGELEWHGIKKDDPLIEGIFYDVWHKPSISPKFLTQGESKAFVESGEYYGEKFEVRISKEMQWFVDGKSVTTNLGKKEGTFSIYETPEMYGARLSQDIMERPDFYFAQREISRTDPQLIKFEQDLVKMVKLIRFIEANNLWYNNDRSCENPFYCDFRSICQSGLEIGPDDVPEGFKKYIKEERNESI